MSSKLLYGVLCGPAGSGKSKFRDLFLEKNKNTIKKYLNFKEYGPTIKNYLKFLQIQVTDRIKRYSERRRDNFPNKDFISDEDFQNRLNNSDILFHDNDGKKNYGVSKEFLGKNLNTLLKIANDTKNTIYSFYEMAKPKVLEEVYTTFKDELIKLKPNNQKLNKISIDVIYVLFAIPKNILDRNIESRIEQTDINDTGSLSQRLERYWKDIEGFLDSIYAFNYLASPYQDNSKANPASRSKYNFKDFEKLIVEDHYRKHAFFDHQYNHKIHDDYTIEGFYNRLNYSNHQYTVLGFLKFFEDIIENFSDKKNNFEKNLKAVKFFDIYKQSCNKFIQNFILEIPGIEKTKLEQINSQLRNSLLINYEKISKKIEKVEIQLEGYKSYEEMCLSDPERKAINTLASQKSDLEKSLWTDTKKKIQDKLKYSDENVLIGSLICKTKMQSIGFEKLIERTILNESEKLLEKLSTIYKINSAHYPTNLRKQKEIISKNIKDNEELLKQIFRTEQTSKNQIEFLQGTLMTRPLTFEETETDYKKINEEYNKEKLNNNSEVIDLNNRISLFNMGFEIIYNQKFIEDRSNSKKIFYRKKKSKLITDEEVKRLNDSNLEIKLMSHNFERVEDLHEAMKEPLINSLLPFSNIRDRVLTSITTIIEKTISRGHEDKKYKRKLFEIKEHKKILNIFENEISTQKHNYKLLPIELQLIKARSDLIFKLELYKLFKRKHSSIDKQIRKLTKKMINEEANVNDIDEVYKRHFPSKEAQAIKTIKLKRRKRLKKRIQKKPIQKQKKLEAIL